MGFVFHTEIHMKTSLLRVSGCIYCSKLETETNITFIDIRTMSIHTHIHKERGRERLFQEEEILKKDKRMVPIEFMGAIQVRWIGKLGVALKCAGR